MASKRRLYRHQQDALAWCNNRSRFGLFMEMRLGKTLTTIRHVERSGVHAKVVVAPLSVLPTWERELSAEGHRSTRLQGSVEQRLSSARFAAQEGCWALVNYEGLHSKGKPQPWTNLKWDCVVLDESTQIRNPQALRSKIACEAFQDVHHKIILSGMPTPSSLWDLFQQIKFLFGGFMGFTNFWRFRDVHGIRPFNGWGDWAPKLGAAAQIKKAAAEHCLSVRRQDADVKMRRVVVRRYVDLPQKVRKTYQQVKREWALGEELYTYAVQKYNTLSQLAAGCCAGFEHTAKANEIVDLLNGELAEQPVVVWTRYLAENRGLVNELVKHRSVWSITGETEQFKRESNVQDWSRCPNGVLVAQQAVFKYGLDLSHASAAVYASVSDDTEEVVQSMDRIVNIRRKHEPLLYVFVVARDTLEDRRIDLLEDRTMTAAKTMAALRNGLRSSLREQLGVSNG